MSDLYSSFMTSHGGQPPKSEQEFRQYLADKQSFLERNQLSVDKMFTSPRNGQPLDWVYGAKAPRVTPDIQAVGYERASVDGKRLAIGLGGRYAEVDDAAFKAAFPNVK